MKLILSLLIMISISFAGNFTRANDIVTDNVTKLQWQDDKDAQTVTKEWKEAISYCKKLTLGGKSDWKLPNIKALRSIADPSNNMPTLDRIFQNSKNNFYWSSTTDNKNINKAKVIHFGFCDEGNDWKYDEYYVRCARAVK